MAPTEWDRELIAYLSAESGMLGEAQVMGIGRLPAADQTRLSGHVSDMVPITKTAWLGKGKDALVDGAYDAFGSRLLARGPLRCLGEAIGRGQRPSYLFAYLGLARRADCELCDVRLERLLHPPGIGCGQPILLQQVSDTPTGLRHRRSQVWQVPRATDHAVELIAQLQGAALPTSMGAFCQPDHRQTLLAERGFVAGRSGDPSHAPLGYPALMSVLPRHEVGRVEIILTCNANQGKERVAPGIGQRCSHPMWRCGLA